MIITTTNTIESYHIEEYVDVVYANVVLGVNIFAESTAQFTDIFGGRSGIYQKKLQNLYDYLKSELETKAKKLSANAIIGVHYNFEELTGNVHSMLMATATGTAVKIVKYDRYSRLKVLHDLFQYNKEGILSDEEYEFEKNKVEKEYTNQVAIDVILHQKAKEDEAKQRAVEQEIDNKHNAKIAVINKCIEETKEQIRHIDINTVDYSSLLEDESLPMDEITINLIERGHVAEAIKYYMDQTGLDQDDAIEYASTLIG